jgi:hypothetical protein
MALQKRRVEHHHAMRRQTLSTSSMKPFLYGGRFPDGRQSMYFWLDDLPSQRGGGDQKNDSGSFTSAAAPRICNLPHLAFKGDGTRQNRLAKSSLSTYPAWNPAGTGTSTSPTNFPSMGNWSPATMAARMPRQAAASIGFAANGSTRQLLQPPADLNTAEKAEFIAVVMGSPPSHFLPSDIATLSLHVRHVVAERTAFAKLQAEPVIDNKPSAWLAVMTAHARVVTTTARRLGINPCGRVAPSKPREPEPVSYYSRAAMESSDETN